MQGVTDERGADRRDGVVTRHLADSVAVTPATAGCYRGAGFAIRSDIDFSNLLNGPTAHDGPADVHYCRGELPHSGAGCILRRFRTFGFAAMEGRRVVVSVCRHYEAVSRIILAGGLNAVAYQRGLLPLHASAVAVGERCVAFCGGAEVGKSTLAAALARAGHPFLCDDLVVVHQDHDGSPLVWPAMRPALTRRSIDLLGGEVTVLTPFAEGDCKAVTNVGEAGTYAARELSCIYLLDWGEPSIRRLSPLQAATILSRYLRNPAWLGTAGTATTIRQRWIDLASRVPIIAITRQHEASTLLSLCEFLVSSWKQDRKLPARM